MKRMRLFKKTAGENNIALAYLFGSQVKTGLDLLKGTRREIHDPLTSVWFSRAVCQAPLRGRIYTAPCTISWPTFLSPFRWTLSSCRKPTQCFRPTPSADSACITAAWISKRPMKRIYCAERRTSGHFGKDIWTKRLRGSDKCLLTSCL